MLKFAVAFSITFGPYLESGGFTDMPKRKVGARKRPNASVKRNQTTTTKSGAKSQTRTTPEYRPSEPEVLLDLEALLSGIDLERLPSVQAAGLIGTAQSATNADTKASYPLSVRQANALLDELSHCWITSDEVVDLLQDLGRWVNRV